MLDPKKWPKKYQYLLMFVLGLIVFLLTISKAHAEEPAQIKENSGIESIKDASVDALTAFVSFVGAAESAAMGNLYTGVALTVLGAHHSGKFLNEVKNAYHYYFDEPQTSQNFNPDTTGFQRD